MTKSDLCIDVLGTVIKISTDEEQDYLNMLMDKYRVSIDRVKKISGLDDPLKIAVLTGFLLCDEMEKAQSSKQKNVDGEAERLTMSMISRLEEILAENDDCSESS